MSEVRFEVFEITKDSIMIAEYNQCIPSEKIEALFDHIKENITIPVIFIPEGVAKIKIISKKNKKKSIKKSIKKYKGGYQPTTWRTSGAPMPPCKPPKKK